MNRLDLLDEILLLSEGRKRSLDCVLAYELDTIPSLEELKAGAKKAQELFPKTSRFEIEISPANDLESFANKQLKSHWHLEEAIIGNTLALKMSHVLGDALSMLLFLNAQLGEDVSDEEIELHKFQAKKDSKYKYGMPSSKWLKSTPGKERIIRTLTLNHDTEYRDFSLNDLLSLALLKSLPFERSSLWVPVNVRKNPWGGFGNGLSRMRLYPSKTKISMTDELKYLRQQKKEAWGSGEIFLPPEDFNLDKPMVKQFLKLWINRPWADWGSLSFSHLHDKNNNLPKNVQKVWGVTNIPDKLNSGLFAFTKGNLTCLTLVANLTADKKSLDDILERMSENFEKIKNAL